MKIKAIFILMIIGIALFIILYGERAYAMLTGKVLYAKNDSPYEDLIQKAANKYGIDANIIKAIIMQESSYRPSVIGYDGLSIGLMQITKPVAHDYFGRDVNFSEFSDPAINIDIGVQLLSKLQKYGFEGMIASYNEGPGNWLKGRHDTDYVSRIMNYYNQYAGIA